MNLYTVEYYKRIESRWLKGRVRNLTAVETLRYKRILREMFDTNLVRTVAQEKE